MPDTLEPITHGGRVFTFRLEFETYWSIHESGKRVANVFDLGDGRWKWVTTGKPFGVKDRAEAIRCALVDVTGTPWKR